MLAVKLLMAALVGAITTTASHVNITFSRNFATEKLNINSSYDLNEFGYLGSRLPKVYGLGHNGSGAVYLPHESFDEFKPILAGKNNASAKYLGQQEKLIQSTKRSATGVIGMVLRNTAGEGDTYVIEAEHTVCHTGNKAPWHYAVVHHITDAYITFWKSDACNGHKGSFNPVCYYYDNPAEVCVFDFKPK
ncbi:uncharacterized protein N7503_000951 [Penicillium pulvis]|uniref:uncharacterized protein n=1 Tax=Penicillium pulvis TaxID=1562058 RepID=UPI0025470A49|nr:uncharacterized protein N7503_000951 [Penicillium pulvis]KAJ5814201.1 hypothetical protein N7503_000951 [Penicillium pulvis]